MKVFLDTNIIIDCLTEREPYFTYSKEVIRECLDGETTGFMATHTVNDIYYIARKSNPNLSSQDLIRAILMFTKMLETANLTASDVEAASLLSFSDFEDALICQCAGKVSSDYIITRNVKDFAKSTIKAITPKDWLNMVTT